jgi:hypothetical protein
MRAPDLHTPLAADPVGEIAKITFEVLPVGIHCHPVYPRRRLLPQPSIRPFERSDVNVVQQRREPSLARPSGRVVHPGEIG